MMEQEVFRYRILRYVPNLIRDEWINIGVYLEQPPLGVASASPRRCGMRVIEDDAEIARVRRVHPSADENVLRALGAEFQARLVEAGPGPAAYLERLDRTLSNALQFGPQVALAAPDFDAALDRLYRDHVERPPAGRAGILENTRAWIRARLNDVFRRHRILGKLERGVRVEEFTQSGDPFRLDYAYGTNGARGYLHAVVLSRDPGSAKVLAYTAARIRSRAPHAEFTAITEDEFAAANPRHGFVARLFADQHIATMPLKHIEGFAEGLRRRLA